ncbi:MAG: tetratricopeptide repeat protein [Pyrinomonadaceae bacterium]
MKNLTAVFCVLSLLVFFGLACKNNPLAKYTKQYHCEILGEPEPQTSDDYLKRAAKHYELNNYADAFDECAFGACAEAVRLDPNNAQALACRGNFYRLLKKYDEALADLNESIRLSPEAATSYQIRSVIYKDRKMYDEAIADQTGAIKIHAEADYQSPYNYEERGELYFLKGDYENAVRDYSKVISIKPDLENIYAKRAEAYRKLGKKDLADADEGIAAGKEPATETEPKKSVGIKTISGGVLNGKAIELPKPVYPPSARAVRASGAVNVQVTVDEKGRRDRSGGGQRSSASSRFRGRVGAKYKI